MMMTEDENLGETEMAMRDGGGVAVEEGANGRTDETDEGGDSPFSAISSGFTLVQSSLPATDGGYTSFLSR